MNLPDKFGDTRFVWLKNGDFVRQF